MNPELARLLLTQVKIWLRVANPADIAKMLGAIQDEAIRRHWPEASVVAQAEVMVARRVVTTAEQS